MVVSGRCRRLMCAIAAGRKTWTGLRPTHFLRFKTPTVLWSSAADLRACIPGYAAVACHAVSGLNASCHLRTPCVCVASLVRRTGIPIVRHVVQCSCATCSATEDRSCEKAASNLLRDGWQSFCFDNNNAKICCRKRDRLIRSSNKKPGTDKNHVGFGDGNAFRFEI